MKGKSIIHMNMQRIQSKTNNTMGKMIFCLQNEYIYDKIAMFEK